jgi:hypothetical protein
VSDHHARELWRRFLAEPSHENAYLWARTEARMRHEIPDPPVADLPLVALAPAFRCLAGGPSSPPGYDVPRGSLPF